MNQTIKIGNTSFKNPIWAASGTFGYGEEFAEILDFNNIGAIITKTVTMLEKEGNRPPRIVETASGLLNSIGLQNKGAKAFRDKHFSRLKNLGTDVIISIAGVTGDEFIACIDILTDTNFPKAFELNLSCPNIFHGKKNNRLIAQDPQAAEKIVTAVSKTTALPLIVKLTPNVTDITEIAKAAENGGAAAISVVNTYRGMVVDADNMRPALGNISGGLSGPAIKPMALLAVWETFHSVSIPIIGIGGIMTGRDVAEFMLCGAKAVQIGTANIVNADAIDNIAREFNEYLQTKKITDLNELVGKLQV